MKYLISWICWKNSCFFQIFLKFYFKKLVADIKTWGKNIIKLDSIFVLGASFFPTKRSLFYWLCISRYIYSMNPSNPYFSTKQTTTDWLYVFIFPRFQFCSNAYPQWCRGCFNCGDNFFVQKFFSLVGKKQNSKAYWG